MYLGSLQPSASVTHCAGVASELCSAGHRVTLYALGNREQLRDLPCSSQVHRVALEAGEEGADGAAESELRLARFVAHLRKQPPRHHVHHAHDWLTGYGLMQARRALSGSFVRTVHQVPDGARPRLLQREADSLRASDLVLAVSDEVRRGLHALHVPSERMASGVDFTRFAKPPVRDVVALGSRLGLSSAGPVLFTYGGISPRKNTLAVLDAFLGVLRRNASATWVIVGDGENDAGARAYRAEFAARVNAAGAWARQAILPAGKLTDAELVASYQVADAVVCASDRSGFGLCALEALAAGAPLVATRSGAFMEYLDRDCADLVDLADPAEFERVLSRVLMRARSDDRRIVSGMERARRYSWSRVAAQQMQQYAALLTCEESPHGAWSGSARRETTGVIFKAGEVPRRVRSR